MSQHPAFAGLDTGTLELPAGAGYRAREPIKLDPRAPLCVVCLPVRAVSPVEFWLCLKQVLEPLNVKLGYRVHKGAEHPQGLLPAGARNQLLREAIAQGARYAIFLDDDVLFPDVLFYRFLGLIRAHPEAALISGVYVTKLEPTEPLIYAPGDRTGAFWDWPLGALVPIDSAGAGCFIVDLDAVRRTPEPWFDDTVVGAHGDHGRERVGHDRYFMQHLRAATGMELYADTGMLLGHLDARLSRVYILPPEAPCFQQPVAGEAYVTLRLQDGALMWRRILEADAQTATPLPFLGYLDWLQQQSQRPEGPPTVRLSEVGAR